MRPGRTAANVAVAALAVAAALIAIGALVPWYTSRPAPIPATTPTVVPSLTGPPFTR